MKKYDLKLIRSIDGLFILMTIKAKSFEEAASRSYLAKSKIRQENRLNGVLQDWNICHLIEII